MEVNYSGGYIYQDVEIESVEVNTVLGHPTNDNKICMQDYVTKGA